MKQKQSNPLLAPATTPYIAYVGIDWADQKHDLCLFDPLEQVFKTHHIVQTKTINRRLEQIQQGVVLTEDQGVVEPLQLPVTALIAQLKVLLPSIASFDAKIEALFITHLDAALFAALPGDGPHLAPRLLVAFGEQRSRF